MSTDTIIDGKDVIITRGGGGTGPYIEADDGFNISDQFGWG